MKKLTLKSIITTALFALMLFAFAFGGITLTRSYAEEQKTTGFTMDKASVRLSEPYGLRFKAKLGQTQYEQLDFDNGDYLGMLIVPQVYLDYFAEDLKGENPDYVTVLESKDLFLANVKNIEPYEDGDYWAFNGVLGKVKYANFNVDFVGIGYYYQNGEYTYAKGINRTLGGVVSANIAKGNDDQVVMSKLHELNAIATAQKLGLSEDDAKTFKEANLAGSLTDNQVANFDNSEYLNLVGASKADSYLSFSDAELIEIAELDGRTALSLTPSVGNYRGANITLVKPTVVKENTVLSVTYKTNANNRIYIGKDTSKRFIATGSNWATVSYLATDLGYEKGSILDSVHFILGTDSGKNALPYYIDEICVTEKVDLGALIDYDSESLVGELANFNHSDYTMTTSHRSAYLDGKLAVLPVWSANNVTKSVVNFARSFTVRNGDYLVINMQTANGNAKLAKKDGTVIALAQQNYTDYRIMLTDLGYSVGDTVSSISFCGDDNTAYINYIKLGNDIFGLKLTGNQLANFDTTEYQSYVDKGTVTNGALEYTGTWGKGVKIAFEGEITLSSNDYLVLKIKAQNQVAIFQNNAEGSSTHNILHRTSTTSTTVGYETYRWKSANYYQTVIMPVGLLGYSENDVLTHLYIANWENSATDVGMSIDWIELVTLSKATLTKEQALAEYAKTVYPDCESINIDFADERAADLLYFDTAKTGNVTAVMKATNYALSGETGITDSASVAKTGVLTLTTGSSNTIVRINLPKDITVTESTVIKIELYSTFADGVVRVSMNNSNVANANANRGYVQNKWCTLNLTWNSAFKGNGVVSGSVWSHIDIAWYGGSVNIKSITITE